VTWLDWFRRRTRRERALIAEARSRERVEVAGLTFEPEPIVRALCAQVKPDIAAGLLARPPTVEAWRIVGRFIDDRDAPRIGETRTTISVPGLVTFACETCARSYPGAELVIDSRFDIHAPLAGRITRSGRCPAGHALGGLPEHMVIA
jgi:hypothetical protein